MMLIYCIPSLLTYNQFSYKNANQNNEIVFIFHEANRKKRSEKNN